MVNMTDSEFAIIKAILKVVSDKCNLYWQDESQAEDDYEKKEYENYLELKKNLKYHIDLDKYKDIDLSKLLYELK
jgi:hypothetical protein